MRYLYSALLKYFRINNIVFEGHEPCCHMQANYSCARDTMHCKIDDNASCCQQGTIYVENRRFSIQVFFVSTQGSQEGFIKSNTFTFGNLLRAGMKLSDFMPID